MATLLYSLTFVWFASEGQADWQIPERPWYCRKSDNMTPQKLGGSIIEGVARTDPRADNSIDLLTYLATLAG